MSVTVDESQVSEMVRRIMTRLDGQAGPQPVGPPGVFATADDAVAAADAAFQRYRLVSIAQRKKIIEAIRRTAIDHSHRLAQMAVDETRLGRVSDKVLKNVLAAEKTPGVEDLPTGIQIGDFGMTVLEPAPFGIILALLPITNPVATVINNAISMLTGGNTVLFAPHPSAQRTSFETMGLLNQAIEKAGGPPNCLVGIRDCPLDTTRALMSHRKISLLCVTGGSAVVRLAMGSGKRTIGAAAGNPPVIVDDTADPAKAAREIVAGGSFDNNLPCTCEKEIIVTEHIADDFVRCLGQSDALVLEPRYLKQLENVVLDDQQHINKAFVGKSAHVILREIGIAADESLRLVVVEVGRDHPLVRHEQIMPVLPLVRVHTFQEAMDVAVEVEGNLHHTALIHSSNINHMSDFGKAINSTIFVKNAPSFAGIGFGGEGPTSFTIAGASGEGLTTARIFTRARRCTLVGAFSLV